MAVVTLVFSGHASALCLPGMIVSLELLPARWLVASSIIDVAIISVLAVNGILMTAPPIAIVGGVLAAAVAFPFILDTVKLAM